MQRGPRQGYAVYDALLYLKTNYRRPEARRVRAVPSDAAYTLHIEYWNDEADYKRRPAQCQQGEAHRHQSEDSYTKNGTNPALEQYNEIHAWR